MKNRKVLIIDSYKYGNELISQHLKDLEAGDIQCATNYEDAERFTTSNSIEVKPMILSESEIPDKNGRRICTSKLLKKLKEQGHIVILHSANSFHEFNEDIKNIIYLGVYYVPKSSQNLGSPKIFYNAALAPALAKAKD